METLRVTIAFILGMALPFAAQRWDRGRLDDEQREGAWNAASWGAAVYAFGPLSMIGWCWVTRAPWSRWRSELPGWSGFWLFLGSALLLATGAVIVPLVVPIWLLVTFLRSRAAKHPWLDEGRLSRAEIFAWNLGAGALALLKGLFATLAVTLGLLAAEVAITLADDSVKQRKEAWSGLIEGVTVALGLAAVVVGIHILTELGRRLVRAVNRARAA